METDSISYQKSGYFNSLIIDYLNEKTELKELYNRFPKLENFKDQIEEKSKQFDSNNRNILVNALDNQYNGFQISEQTKNNITSLSNSNTYTITTGHQLNLFTGPLYFLYKIISTINLCKKLKEKHPEHNFIPVYWMATEDHDFEEINHFNYKDVKIKWNKKSNCPVGRIKTEGIENIFKSFELELGTGEIGNYLKDLFEKSYLKNSTLSHATRFMVNALFGNEGLVIIDGDDSALKRLFIPIIKNELTERKSFYEISKTNDRLKNSYDLSVNPREINLFYIEDTIRERIIFEKNEFKVNNTKLTFSENEILNLVETNPEKFSPNVVLRPVYEEVILPNLCYIGGGGEIAYWLQLKSVFDIYGVTFPILLIRNSVVLITEKQNKKANKLQVTWNDLFCKQTNLITLKTHELSKLPIDFSELKYNLSQQFEKLLQITTQTDTSFLGAVKAQEKKQIKGLENLEKRLLKAEKRIHAEKLNQIMLLQNELFPNQTLQERSINFSEFYIKSNGTLIEKLIETLDPLEFNFTIITL